MLFSAVFYVKWGLICCSVFCVMSDEDLSVVFEDWSVVQGSVLGQMRAGLLSRALFLLR